MAIRDTAPARSQPARRAGIELAGPGKLTGSTNATNRDVVAPAKTELTTPWKSTTKATTTVTAVASQVVRETRVPRQISTAPASASEAWAATRSPIEPPKSTNKSMANAPKAEKIATVGFPMTFSATANTPGMTIAARPARRRAENPASRARS